MPDDVVRVTCAHENCGTFPLDEALHRKLQRTGETFTCLQGHPQHFGETTEQQLRDRIEELEREVERYKNRSEAFRENAHELHDRWRDEKDRRQSLEQLFLETIDGVVEVDEEEWMWACECGGHARSRFDSETDAEQALRQHRRHSCDLEVENGATADA